ncbi:hypothetical protein [Bacillus sp. JCM 19041]|uniref:hypothetical protein n=1 Tax=Bacillus sp. JCM 19041 TaxID=1460637 RepID=UPI0006D05C00
MRTPTLHEMSIRPIEIEIEDQESFEWFNGRRDRSADDLKELREGLLKAKENYNEKERTFIFEVED